MTRNLLRAGALACALMTSTCLTAPALAQSQPEFRNLDANGVDLTRGDHVLGFTEGVVGSGQAALALERVRMGVFQNVTQPGHVFHSPAGGWNCYPWYVRGGRMVGHRHPW